MCRGLGLRACNGLGFIVVSGSEFTGDYGF